ncbi:MAG: tRNA-modifying protein YgfZ [Methylobacteriaceae bacterium]|jgi:folate-binding protein YgfZ|nr:tRNA-modifying protein YgfZ [Methylobacteriaceae bacterium]
MNAFTEFRPILLADRGVLRVAGPQCETFLQDLVTNDVTSLGPGEARYAALLTPQGKILFDMIIVAIEENGERAFLIDCAREQATDLTKRLIFYKLRAKVAVEDRSVQIAVMAYLDAAPQVDGIVVRDPRSEGLGFRAYVPREHAAAVQTDLSVYETRRIAAGVPQGGTDFAYGDAFPHEANLDRLNGVDFKKGCYVGQEVVSRMQHRSTTRKRIVKVGFSGIAPQPGAEIKAGDNLIGSMGSSAGEYGLAMVRLDRADEAKAAGVAPLASGTALNLQI